jgi:hypothetical protein
LVCRTISTCTPPPISVFTLSDPIIHGKADADHYRSRNNAVVRPAICLVVQGTLHVEHDRYRECYPWTWDWDAQRGGTSLMPHSMESAWAGGLAGEGGRRRAQISNTLDEGNNFISRSRRRASPYARPCVWVIAPCALLHTTVHLQLPWSISSGDHGSLPPQRWPAMERKQVFRYGHGGHDGDDSLTRLPEIRIDELNRA